MDEEDSPLRHHSFYFEADQCHLSLPSDYAYREVMCKDEVEKVDSNFVLKFHDDLKQHEPLRKLRVASDFITKDGATEFAKYFANHNILSLTVEGESDRRSGEIHFLNLSKVRTSGIVEMIKAFANVNVERLAVERITYSDLDEDLLAILKILAKRKHLATLSLSVGDGNKEKYTLAGVIGICRFLGKNPDVTEINLEGIAFKKVGSAMFCRALATNTNLQSLNLAGCSFTDDLEPVLSALAMNKTLTNLDISLKKLSSEQYKQIGEALGKNTHLKKLSWTVDTAYKANWPMEMHFDVFPNLIETNSALDQLSFSHKGVCVSQLAKAIQKNTTLKVLDLDAYGWIERATVSEELLKAIFASNLQEFNFGEAFLKEHYLPVRLSEANCQAMKSNTSLRKLTCPLILKAFVALFFSSIPSQLKEISTLLINPENGTGRNVIEQLFHGLSRTTLATLLIELDCEESLESFFFQNLPPVPLERFILKIHVSGRFPDVAAVEQALHINGCIKKLALMCTRSKEPENEPEIFASHLLELLKCLPPSLEALEEALSENYSLTECGIGSEHFKQIVERNRKLKEEARFKRGKVALGKSHEISRDGSPPRKLVKYD